MKIAAAIGIAACALALAPFAFANGLGGQRLEKVVGNLIVDVGTDQSGVPMAGTPIQFDFNLLKSDTREYVPFATVAVKFIKSNGDTAFQETVPYSLFGPTLLVYTFTEGGTFNLDLAFYDDQNRVITGAVMPITIKGGGTGAGKYILFGVVALTAIGLIAGGVMLDLKKKK